MSTSKATPETPITNIPPELVPFVKKWREANEKVISAYVTRKMKQAQKAKLLNNDADPASGDKSKAEKEGKELIEKGADKVSEGKLMDGIKDMKDGEAKVIDSLGD